MTATSKFESTTISLPRPVPAHGGRDPEEGEISDGVEEGEEVFSDISDEELESNYGRHGIKRGDKGGNNLMSESKSPLKNGENELPDDYEDVDEDILYLRLMALRSMIPTSDIPSAASNKSPISSKSIEDEMKELLEEADKAAAQSIPPPPIIDIADSDEEKMDLYMKTMTTNMSFLAPISTKVKEEDVREEPFGEPNLEYLVMKLKHSLENGENAQERQEEERGSVYSPTQSPVQLSPPSSPNVIPLPPEGILKPPGDDEYVGFKTICSGVHQPVDMELGSENEAEIQFFKHQKEIPSVAWPQQQAQILIPSALPSSALTHPQMLYNCDHYLYQERMYQERSPDIKKNDLLKAVTAKPPPPPPLPMPSNLQSSINSSGLTKNKKRMRKRKSTTTIKCINSSDEEELGGVQSKKRVTPPPPPAVPLEPIDSEDEEAMRAHLLSTMAAKRSAKKKEVVDPPSSKEILKAKSEKPLLRKSSSKVVKKKQPSKLSDICGLTTEIPFDKLKKYFPNMVRPFIIPLNIPNSSEDESTSINSFQANLDLLMKNAREGSASLSKVKRVPPPKPVRKNPPRSKCSTALLMTNKSTHPIRKRHISLVEKESLKTRSSIEHLPIERQKEYKMLLARIAVKEKKQQIESKKEMEDPEEMRRTLLSKMKNLKSKIDQNKTDLKKKVLVESKENSEPKDLEETSSSPPLVVHERVLASEKEVITSRNDVVNGLFKLSAQLSQFRSESEKLITAQNFLSDLLKQVEETRKLIKKKEERITQLRHVVKCSHLSISKKRKDLSGKESKCKKLGEKLIGGSYELPETGADQIKQKLVQIASNAKLCKKVNRDSASTNNSTEEDGTKTRELSGVSSSIAHLRPGSGRGEHVIDPHQEFCRFELLGKCNDDACPYQHHKSVS